MLTVRLAAHSAACGLFFMIACILWRDRGAVAWGGRLGAAVAIGAAADAIASEPLLQLGSAPLGALATALSWGNSPLFWLWMRAGFDDDFTPRIWHAALWAGIAAAGAFVAYGGPLSPQLAQFFETAHPYESIGFNILAILPLLKTWRADLVEGRRKARYAILAGSLVFNVGLLVLHSPLTTISRLPRDAVQAVALFALAALAGWYVFRVAKEFAPANAAAVAPNVVDMDKRDASGAKPILLRRIDRLMTAERIYRREGLSIGAMAVELGTPEYRLRQVINEGLGYRNFNAFLNRYRIEEVKAALADPGQKDVPILTIAMDAGFQSIGPFNRAFKAETGVTPTEYRRAKLSEPATISLRPQENFKIGQSG
jgi:AraC-like DNA-binding protein